MKVTNPALNVPLYTGQALPAGVPIPALVTVEAVRPVSVVVGWDGSAMWGELHSWARTAPTEAEGAAWLAEFGRRVACGACREHWRALVVAFPPLWGAGLFAWSVQAHNQVNARLGRREWSLEEAAARWPG
jgi:hypothetical protein